jgi:dolichol-phosphate mannosyltransferase
LANKPPTAGLAAAKGEAIVFLDADLQDPPELLAELIAKWREGFKVVTACRSSRAERGIRRWLFDGFHSALKCYFGCPQTTVMYARRERAVGAPKRSLRKLFSYALNGLLSFSDLPLQWIGLTGVLVSTASFGYGAVLLLIKLGQIFGLFAALEVKGFTTLAVAVFCLSGIQLLCLGIIGQYLARMYREIKSRPAYVVEQILSSHGTERVREPGQD